MSLAIGHRNIRQSPIARWTQSLPSLQRLVGNWRPTLNRPSLLLSNSKSSVKRYRRTAGSVHSSKSLPRRIHSKVDAMADMTSQTPSVAENGIRVCGLKAVLEREYGLVGVQVKGGFRESSLITVETQCSGPCSVVSMAKHTRDSSLHAENGSDGSEVGHGSSLLASVLKTSDGKSSASAVGETGEELEIAVYRGKPWMKFKPHRRRLLESLGGVVGQICAESSQGSLGGLKKVNESVNESGNVVSGSSNPKENGNVVNDVGQGRGVWGPSDMEAFLVEDVALGEVSKFCPIGGTCHASVDQVLAQAISKALLHKNDLLEVVHCVCKGFHTSFPLNKAELASLHPLVARTLHEDGNVETLSEIRKVVAKWQELSPTIVHCVARLACGLEPCPKYKEFLDWVGPKKGTFLSILPFEMNAEPKVVLDFSVEGMELKYMMRSRDVELGMMHIEHDIATARAEYGVGRYLEPRAVYTSQSYLTMGNDGPMSRTIHLGVDLFMPAGTAIHAPLAGKVHSFRDNNQVLDYGPTVILEHVVSDTLTFYTLYGHLARKSLIGKEEGSRVEAGGVVGWVGTSSENGQWVPHVHFQIMLDMCGLKGDFPGVAYPSLMDVYHSLCPNPNLLLGIEGVDVEFEYKDVDRVYEDRKRVLGKSTVTLFDGKPVRIVRGFMQNLYDDMGRPYLDLYNNVQHVGHQHPRVVRAGQQQMELLNTNSRYLHEGLTEYTKGLLATFPDPLNVCYFVTSGSEANELAIRLAHTYTDRKDMIVVEGGYHGNSTMNVELSSYKFDRKGGKGPRDWVHKVPLPDPYRGIYTGEDSGPKYAQCVEDVIKDMESKGRKPCAFISESILSCAGQIFPPKRFFGKAYEVVRAHGGVCISDEVQTGFGRVGEHFWSFQLHGVVPDIVTLGKPIGNGYPMGVVVTTQEIAAKFANGMEFFSTFGGNPVAARIGHEVLNVVKDEKLQAHARELGNILMEGLAELKSRFPVVGDVRGCGLFWGIEFVKPGTQTPAPELADCLVNRMKDCGILLGTDGMDGNVVKFKPPMAVSKVDLAAFLQTFSKILEEDAMQG